MSTAEDAELLQAELRARIERPWGLWDEAVWRLPTSPSSATRPRPVKPADNASVGAPESACPLRAA